MANNPNLIVKSGEPQPVKRVLSVRERESLQKAASIYGYANQASDNYIPGSQGAAPVNVPWLNVNRPRLNEQQRQVMKVLEDGTPEPVHGEEKDKLAKRADILKSQFEEFLQTREECHVVKRDNPAFFSALDKAKKWSTKQEKLGGRTPEEVAQEYRYIMRRLEPEDENADSLDRLRKQR
jgi:hypothetical protein